MAYLNPYEGLGGALMGIGNNLFQEEARKKSEKAQWERERKRAEEQAAQEELRAKERGLERDIEQGRWNAGLARDDIKEQQRQKERAEDRADLESRQRRMEALEAARIAANKNEERAQQIIAADGTVMLRTGNRAEEVLDAKGKPLMTAPPGTSRTAPDPFTQAQKLLTMAAGEDAAAKTFNEDQPEYKDRMDRAAAFRARAQALTDKALQPKLEGSASGGARAKVPRGSFVSETAKAIGAGVGAAQTYGRDIPSAYEAGVRGDVPKQVAADTISSIEGTPTKFTVGDSTTVGKPNATGKVKSKEWRKAYQTYVDAGASPAEARQLADEDVPGG